jgi:hypothetical protein
LSTAKDKHKDQTDFLAQNHTFANQKLMFPIGHLLKSEVRAIAAAENCPVHNGKTVRGSVSLEKSTIMILLNVISDGEPERSLSWKQEKSWENIRLLVSHHWSTKRIGAKRRSLVRD